ncbi:MAG: T9SS type A sorting domain-containing protein [Ignavibacteria bacterium]
MQKIAVLFFLIINSAYSQTDSIIVEFLNGTTRSFAVSTIKDITLINVSTRIKETILAEKIFNSFKLHQNYPNPFNPSTTIEYEIPAPGNVEIKIYDIRGCEVRSFGSEQMQPGMHSQVWDGKNNYNFPVPSGTYICRVSFNDSYLTNKLLLIK